MNPTITSIVETDVIVVDPDDEVDLSMLKKVKVEIQMKNTSTSISNAISRSFNEMPNYALMCNFEKIDTDDEYMNKTLLVGNINLLPLRKITDEEAKETSFSINIKNDSEEIILITAGDMTRVGPKPKEPMFFPYIELTYLNPGCYLKIEDMGIYFENGVGNYHPKFNNVQNSVSFPVNYNDSSTTATYTEQIIRFNINHVVPSVKNMGMLLTALGVQDLINRLKHVLNKLIGSDNLLYLKKFDDHIEFTIEETHTISEVLNRLIHQLHPDVSYASCTIRLQMNQMFVEIYHGLQSEKVLENAIREAIKIFGNILAQIKK